MTPRSVLLKGVAKIIQWSPYRMVVTESCCGILLLVSQSRLRVTKTLLEATTKHRILARVKNPTIWCPSQSPDLNKLQYLLQYNQFLQRLLLQVEFRWHTLHTLEIYGMYFRSYTILKETLSSWWLIWGKMYISSLNVSEMPRVFFPSGTILLQR